MPRGSGGCSFRGVSRKGGLRMGAVWGEQSILNLKIGRCVTGNNIVGL